MIQEDRRAKPKRGETISTLAGSNIYTFGLSDTGAQLPAVNLKYLADFMLLFPDARAFYTDPVHPIIFRSPDGDGLLMPVRAENARIRRQPPAAAQEDKTPAIGLHTFAALYA